MLCQKSAKNIALFPAFSDELWYRAGDPSESLFHFSQEKQPPNACFQPPPFTACFYIVYSILSAVFCICISTVFFYNSSCHFSVNNFSFLLSDQSALGCLFLSGLTFLYLQSSILNAFPSNLVARLLLEGFHFTRENQNHFPLAGSAHKKQKNRSEPWPLFPPVQNRQTNQHKTTPLLFPSPDFDPLASIRSIRDKQPVYTAGSSSQKQKTFRLSDWPVLSWRLSKIHPLRIQPQEFKASFFQDQARVDESNSRPMDSGKTKADHYGGSAFIEKKGKKIRRIASAIRAGFSSDYLKNSREIFNEN